MLKYIDLTPQQKAEICNGCGSKGGWIKPPDFLFKASCNHHDFKYWLGGTKKDRKLADVAFHDWMKIDIREAKVRFLKKIYYRIWADAYYRAVRLFGGKAFKFID